jgi:hypothetical protein
MAYAACTLPLPLAGPGDNRQPGPEPYMSARLIVVMGLTIKGYIRARIPIKGLIRPFKGIRALIYPFIVKPITTINLALM